MKKRRFVRTGAAMLALSVFAAGCTMTGPGSGDPAARRAAIDAGADQALSNLYRQVQGSDELVAASRGVLVFPSVLSAGFLIGASHGQGVLRKGGRTVGYYSMTEASAGLLAGAQSQALFVLFMTQEALDRFEASRGWTAGVDGSIALISVGATTRVTTQTAQQPIIGFVLTNSGLMGNLSLNGNRFNRLDL